MQVEDGQFHVLCHLEQKEEQVSKNVLGDWIEVAMKNTCSTNKMKRKQKSFKSENQFEKLQNDDEDFKNSFNSTKNDHVIEKSILSGMHNCIGHDATCRGLAAGGFKSPGGCSKDKTDTRAKMTKNVAKRQMPDMIFESDPEFEEYVRTAGSNHFGSSLKTKKKIQETRTFGTHFGSSVKVEEEVNEKMAYAGSNCGHFGSGSSPPGCLLNLLEHKAGDAENVISAVDEGWEQMSILIDSGSTETVAPENTLIGYELTSTDWSETGKGYSAANGTDIPNLGEKIVKAQASNGMWCTMRFQVCNVTKPLGSVSRICQAGSRVVFGPHEEGSYIEHVKTRKRTMLRQSKGLYYLDVWIAPSSTFPRQGSNM
jgi:hypothetical protein